tara:strand:- start:181 stop:438 length:258 start_codon:yes stop_codon:yes gene_type:complete
MNKLLLSILICMIFFLFIKSDGLMDYHNQKTYYESLVSKKTKLDKELNTIKTQNHLLKFNKRYIEKTAREEYFYIYPGEIIVSFK